MGILMSCHHGHRLLKVLVPAKLTHLGCQESYYSGRVIPYTSHLAWCSLKTADPSRNISQRTPITVSLLRTASFRLQPSLSRKTCILLLVTRSCSVRDIASWHDCFSAHGWLLAHLNQPRIHAYRLRGLWPCTTPAHVLMQRLALTNSFYRQNITIHIIPARTSINESILLVSSMFSNCAIIGRNAYHAIEFV